jgi:hypothetical protein
MMTNGRTALGDAIEISIAELDLLIDRHFSVRRELVVERESAKHWTASIGDTVLYRSPDGRSTLRFARTFAERTPGVDVVLAEAWRPLRDDEWSVRVDNVVPIRVEA